MAKKKKPAAKKKTTPRLTSAEVQEQLKAVSIFLQDVLDELRQIRQAVQALPKFVPAPAVPDRFKPPGNWPPPWVQPWQPPTSPPHHMPGAIYPPHPAETAAQSQRRDLGLWHNTWGHVPGSWEAGDPESTSSRTQTNE